MHARRMEELDLEQRTAAYLVATQQLLPQWMGAVVTAAVPAAVAGTPKKRQRGVPETATALDLVSLQRAQANCAAPLVFCALHDLNQADLALRVVRISWRLAGVYVRYVGRRHRICFVR